MAEGFLRWAFLNPEIAVPLLFLLVLAVLLLFVGPGRGKMRLRILLVAMAVVACVGAAAHFAARYLPAAPAPLLDVDSADLPRTAVVASDTAPIPAGKNVLWCASFQLAWDALRRDVLSGSPVAADPRAEAHALDDGRFPAGDIDAGSFVAMAGGAQEASGFVQAVRNRFDEEVELPVPRPQEVFAAAFLSKDLPFDHPFETFEDGISFSGRGVRAFGLNPHSDNPRKDEILGQVRIHLAESDRDPDNPLLPPDRFVLELLLQGGRDRLFLARIDAAPTLRETWEKVRAVARDEGKRARRDTVLAIPKLNFHVRHRFRELEGMPIASTAGATLTCAAQTTRFRLDETGARLKSAARLEATLGILPHFIFDRPFLVALVQKGATRPYLLLWIANEELLAPQ